MTRLTAGGVSGSTFVGGGNTATYLDTTALWTYGDSLSWTKGTHAFKFGGEIRRGHSLGYDAGIAVTSTPRAVGGDAPLAAIPTTAIGATNMPGLAGTTVTGNNQRMRNLLSFLAGSLSGITQLYYLNSPTKLDAFDDYKTARLQARFWDDAITFFRQLVLVDPQSLASASALIAGHRLELEYLRETIDFTLRVTRNHGEASEWTADNEFYWRFATRNQEVPGALCSQLSSCEHNPVTVLSRVRLISRPPRGRSSRQHSR